ncbi:MAG: O-antigen ligase family protein [Deltaproteobacteria bacterium]|nr:O-antigen ligase family protein [Deltaproteobacteria bacterium]
METIPKWHTLDSRGQTTLQLILPLLIVLFLLVAFALMIPVLSMTKTIALMAGMGIFLVSFVSTEIALYILIFSMLLSPEFIVGATSGTSLGRGVTLRLDDFLLVTIGFSWLAKMAINKELGLFLKTPLNQPIAYYIIVCLVSTLLGVLFGRVDLKTGFFFVLKYFEYMIVYFMVVNHLSSKKQIRYYLWAMLLTCAIVSVIGITAIPGGGRVSAPFEGKVGEPNTFGGYLVFMISITTGLLLAATSVRRQILYGFLAVLFLIPLFYTQSRTSYLAAIPAMFAFVLFSKRREWIMAGLVLVGLSLPLVSPDAVKKRVEYTFTQGRNRTDVVQVGGVKLDTSTSARIMSWKEASKDWIRHPFLGFGVTGYRFVDAQYVRVVTESGLLGLIFFSALAVAVFKQGYRSLKGATGTFETGLCLGFLAGYIGLLTHAVGANTFIIVRIMEPFWFVTAMVVRLPDLEKGEGAAEVPAEKARPRAKHSRISNVEMAKRRER